jgi:LuxR family maltose regulon positive regulatory protein
MDILSTKVLLPRRPATLLRRQRLLDFLLAQADKRLLLLSAPAGYGKTTLLVDFAGSAAAPVAWFSADEDDKDLRSFVEYLLAAIRQTFPTAGQVTHGLLQTNRGNPDPAILAERLAADLSVLPDALNIVVDDYHLVDESPLVGRFVATLLQRLPPGVRLILVGRTIPSLTPETLSLLAAQGDIAGLGMDELRFTTDEVRELFETCFNLHLPEAEIERVARETEGWIAGIRLTTHTIWQGLLRELVANRGKENLYTYLANQVLDQQTQPVQDFLLGTCILQEMEADLCNRLLSRTDSTEVLRVLENRSLFVMRLDAGESPRFRYHPLFAAFLQDRLGRTPQQLLSLHERAGAILEERGQLEQAIRHFLAAKAPDSAARVIEVNARKVYDAGRLTTLISWMEALPPELLSSRPQLLRVRGKALLELGRPREALQWLSLSRERFAEANDLAGAALTQVDEAEARRLLGQFTEAIALSRESLLMLERVADPVAQAKVHRNLGITLCQQGEMREGISALREALSQYDQLGDLISVGYTHHDLGVALRRSGDLAASEFHFQQALARLEQMGDHGRASHTLNSLGVGLHLQGKYDEALQVYSQAQEKAQQAGMLRTITTILIGKGDVYRDLGRYAEASGAYDEARQLVEQSEAPILVLYLLIAQGSLYRLRNDMLRAAALLRRAYEEARERNAEFEKAQASLQLGILHYEQGNLPTARDYLGESRTIFRSIGTRHELARVYLHLARLASLDGHLPAAMDDLCEVFRNTLELGTHAFLVPDARRMTPMLRLALARRVGGDALADLLRRAESPAPGRGEAEAKLPLVGSSPLPVRVLALGPARVLRGENAVSVDEWRALKARDLLFFLLIHGESRREEIGAALWPEATPAQVQDVFHVTLHRLRRALGAPEWVLFRAETYALNRQLPFWSDVEEFQDLLRGAQDLERVAPAEAVERYRRAVALYQGDFMADTTAEWALPFQRNLAHAYEDSLRRLAHLYLDREDLSSAAGCFQRLLERDYYREEIHRELLSAYARLGQPGMAHEHYRKLQRRLRLELDVEPETATRELHHSIRIGRALPSPTSSAYPYPYPQSRP